MQIVGRRVVAEFADANVAITRNIALRQPLPRQHLIYNPFDYKTYAAIRNGKAAVPVKYTFGFLGRLVKEKGVEDLLHALSMLNHSRRHCGEPPEKLQVIGDGPDRTFLTHLAERLHIAADVDWSGFKTGEELAQAIKSTAVFVVPSRWEEPMGVVALELMAAGKPIIVSARGGLSECAGNACLTFENGNRRTLCDTMVRLSQDTELQSLLIQKGLVRIEKFAPEVAICEYLKLFEEVLAHRKGKLIL
jgi:glycosyltransferase involved in cell wall biosynthesis